MAISVSVASSVMSYAATDGNTDSNANNSYDSANTAPMYRLYNPNSGEHFYTANEGERENLLYDHWQYEGIGWIAPKKSKRPVYRLYNPNAGDHHYTTSKYERDVLVEAGWNDEGIGWYSDDEKRVPLYRQYNPNARAGAHNYTTSAGERSMLVAAGWNDEGIGWYAVDEGSPAPKVTQAEDDAYASIEGVMNLRGAGSGYHTKIDISGGSAVVSFGIQYEKDIRNVYPQFPGSTVFLVENVMGHATEPGPEGKEYLYLKSAPQGQDVKVRLSWYSDGTIKFFVNDMEIGRSRTTMYPPFIFAAEGSVARNGDSIDGSIKDIHVKVGTDSSDYGTVGIWNDTSDFFGLRGDVVKLGEARKEDTPYSNDGQPVWGADVTIKGTSNIPGDGPDGKPWTWDTSFSAVEPSTQTTGHPLSAIINIAQRWDV
ncbi:hypothetical protein [Bifidobacterium goeldii]|nr:hypothetical protein [Bifidobacterium goeldii]